MKNGMSMLFLLSVFYLPAQSLADFIQQHALALDQEAIFAQIKDYKCLMVGEMHGSAEAAVFTENLVKLSAGYGKKVLLGLEIPEDDVELYIKNPTVRNLKNTRFFKEGYGDGRNSTAWFHLINSCKNLKNVTFCFFDINTENKDSLINRDSLMFLNLMTAYKKDTGSLIITLSGNIHNKIRPYKNNRTLGCYLLDYFSKNKIMAINHLYAHGTVYNKISENLQIREMKGQTGIFTTAVSLENYFLPRLPEDFPSDYTAILYTKLITASFPITVKYKHSTGTAH